MIGVKSREKTFLIILALLIFLITICCNPRQEQIVAKADSESFAITQGMYDSYTDSDYLVTNTSKKITEYTTDNSLYKATSNIYASNGAYFASIQKDDAIVQIIPKELFANIGEHLYIGKEYGFFVSTIAQSSTSTNRRSTVIVFDIITQNDLIETIDNFIVELTPIFQLEYVYLTQNENVFNISSISNRNSYNKQVSYSTTAPVVIPIAVVNIAGEMHYEQVEKYYLKDICFSAQILNEQALNRHDPFYDCSNDDGAFFTAIDYTYDGLSRYIIEPTTEQKVMFGLDTVSLALGVASTFLPDLGVLGLFSTILSGSAYVYNLNTSYYEILMRGQEDTVTISSGQLTTQRLYTRRDEQIKNYNGKLVKVAGVCVNSNGKDSIWYGTNSNATVYFTVSNSGDEYARYYREIGLQVVDSNGNQKCIGSSIYHYTYGNPITEKIEFEKETPVYLLPNGTNKFVFDALYLSDYKITINSTNSSNSTEPVCLKVNDNIVTGTDNVFYTKINPKYNIPIQVYGNTNAINATIKIEPSSNLTNISVPKNGSYLIQYDVLNMECRKISLTNEAMRIDKILIFSDGDLKNYSFNSTIVPSANEVCIPLETGKKYILISNPNNQTNVTDIIFSDVALLNMGVNANKTIMEGNYTYYKFTAPDFGAYTFTFDFDEAFLDMKIFNSEFSNVTSGKFEKTMLALNLSGTYWVAYRNNFTNGNNPIQGDIIVSHENYSYKLKIDGVEKVFKENISLEVDKNYQLEFWINDIEYTYAISCTQGNNGEPLNIQSGVLALSYDFSTDNTNILVQFCYFDGTIPRPVTILIITPIPSTKISILNSVNTETQLGFVWQVASSEITGFRYKISGVNGKKFTVTVTNATSGTEGILSKVNHELISATITITDIIKGATEHQYNPNNLYTYNINICFASGSGTSEDPFLISNPRHFNNIKYASKANTYYYFKQTDTLDFDGTATARNVSFYGNYNSNAKSIKNVVINDSGALVGGLFSENHGTISPFASLTITVYASRQGAMVGGMVGVNYGDLSAAIAFIVNIESPQSQGAVGGVAGKNEVGAKITPGLTGGTIKAKSDVGGIAGVNNGTINSGSCSVEITYYQYSSVNRSIGGIVGLNNPAGSLIGSMGFRGKLIYGGYTSTLSSWNGISNASVNIAPRIGKIIGENCAPSSNLRAEFTYNGVTTNVDLLTSAQRAYVNAYIYIGNNKA